MGTCNAGKVTYSGVEGEADYAFPFGMTLFANGSINDAKQAANNGTVPGTTPNPAQELANTPKWTYAGGFIFAHGPWHASISYKQVGTAVVYSTISSTGQTVAQLKIPSYDTWNAAFAYDFKNVQVKLQGFNLFDKRNMTNYAPSGNGETTINQTAQPGFLTFQSGRELQLTIVAKY